MPGSEMSSGSNDSESASDDKPDYTCVGRITGVFGIKGWVKVQSFTEPEANVFEYHPWRVKLGKDWVEINIDQAQPHKAGWIAHIEGIDDRNDAELYKLKDIWVDRSQFSVLDDDEYYWHQLVGMRVIAVQASTTPRDLGVVTEMLETGANDVMVVQGDSSSIDDQERLIPYVFDRYVTNVDLEKNAIMVDWHIED